MAKITAYQLADQYRMMDRGEVDLLKSCVAQLEQQPVIVNIGAGAGTSVLAMFEERPKATIFSVDKKPVPEERERLIAAGYAEALYMRLQGDSARVGRSWPGIPLDLVFVDGAHHDEAVIADIEAWRPHVRLGGFMLFHDYDHRNVPGLTVVVDNMMADAQRIGKSRYLVAFRIV